MRNVPVTKRALIQRINRALAHDDRVLKAGRGRAKEAYGEYFIVDTRRNQAVEGDVDVEALGRKLNVLQPFEKLAKE